MTTLRQRLLVPFIAAMVVLTLVAGPVAARDHVVRDHYVFTVEDADVCGVIVDISVDGTFRGTIKNYVIGPADPPANDFWIGTFNNHGSETHTNVATGETVVVSWRVNVQEASLEYIGDGDYAYTFAANGIDLRIDGGRPVNVGRIVITDIIHFGDLSTWEDDYFVSGSASQIAGPHPAYQNEAAFCEAYLAAMG